MRFRITIWIIAFIVVGWWISFTVVNLNFCTPITDIWNMQPGPRNCINVPPTFMANSWFNIGTDVIILVLPLRVVWTMHLHMHAKIGLSLVFLIGVM